LEYQQQYWAVTDQESEGFQQLGHEGLICEEPKIRETCNGYDECQMSTCKNISPHPLPTDLNTSYLLHASS